MDDVILSPRQADDRLQVYGERGVYTPAGMTAAEIMKAAEVLEDQFDVAPYVSRAMARAVISVLKGFHEKP